MIKHVKVMLSVHAVVNKYSVTAKELYVRTLLRMWYLIFSYLAKPDSIAYISKRPSK